VGTESTLPSEDVPAGRPVIVVPSADTAPPVPGGTTGGITGGVTGGITGGVTGGVTGGTAEVIKALSMVRLVTACFATDCKTAREAESIVVM